ncbi:MAG: hypothetical protein AAB316_09425 [Bacteroidota bacterium]
MKLLSILSSAAICAVALFSACKNDSDSARDAAVQNATQQTTPAASTAPTDLTAPGANPAQKAPEPAQNAAGVWHYTCPKGCAGGAGSAAACAKCGTTLAHNAAYHPAPNSNPAAAAGGVINASDLAPGSVTKTPVTVGDPATAKTAEPAQNAKGVWHYTCASGCAGGAGSATACAKCGKTLAHNTAYHQ